MITIRDQLWLWGHEAGSHDPGAGPIEWNLPSILDQLERVATDHEIFLGCYMWDLEPRAPMPLDRFQRQCELGLKWLEEGRIAGMVFLASRYCDLQLETVASLRVWINEVGRRPLQRLNRASYVEYDRHQVEAM